MHICGLSQFQQQVKLLASQWWTYPNYWGLITQVAQWEESFFPKTSVTIVILFWLKWAGYLAVAGLNLLAQLSDRRSPYGV